MCLNEQLIAQTIYKTVSDFFTCDSDYNANWNSEWTCGIGY